MLSFRTTPSMNPGDAQLLVTDFEQSGADKIRARLRSGEIPAGTPMANMAVQWLTMVDHKSNEDHNRRIRRLEAVAIVIALVGVLLAALALF